MLKTEFKFKYKRLTKKGYPKLANLLQQKLRKF